MSDLGKFIQDNGVQFTVSGVFGALAYYFTNVINTFRSDFNSVQLFFLYIGIYSCFLIFLIISWGLIKKLFEERNNELIANTIGQGFFRIELRNNDAERAIFLIPYTFLIISLLGYMVSSNNGIYFALFVCCSTVISYFLIASPRKSNKKKD